jgi:hypothetical protein
MTKWINLFCGVIAVLLLVPTEALCEGYGFYGWGRGWATVGVPGEVEDLVPEFKDLEIDLRHDHFTFGYMHDGASTPEERFGWRFNFGLDIVVAKFEGTNAPSGLGFGLDVLSSDIYDVVGFGFAAKGTYGYGFVRKERVRVWAGPAVRLSANYVDPKSTSFQEGFLSIEVDPRGAIASFGGGIEGGVRYKVSPDLTFDFSTGFLYNFFGNYQDTNLKINGQTPAESDASFLMGQEPFLFVQIALRFDFSKGKDSQ